jgi:hypothetical protein
MEMSDPGARHNWTLFFYSSPSATVWRCQIQVRVITEPFFFYSSLSATVWRCQIQVHVITEPCSHPCAGCCGCWCGQPCWAWWCNGWLFKRLNIVLIYVQAAVGVDVGHRPGSDDATVGYLNVLTLYLSMCRLLWVLMWATVLGSDDATDGRTTGHVITEPCAQLCAGCCGCWCGQPSWVWWCNGWRPDWVLSPAFI